MPIPSSTFSFGGGFRRLIVLVGLLLGLGLGAPAQADISVNIGASSFQLAPGGPYTIDSTKTVGTVLATANVPITANGISGLCVVTTLFTPVASLPAVDSQTFGTGVPGLGIRLSYFNGSGYTTILPGTLLGVGVGLSAGSTSTALRAQLIVTGTVSAGTMGPLPTLNITYAAVGCSGLVNATIASIGFTGNYAVNAPSCTVPTPSLAVTLPTVSVRALASAGQTADGTSFVVPLNCSTATPSVYVTLTDATTPGNTSSVLSLASGSTATNVGLQLLKPDGTAVSYGPDSAAAGNTNQYLVGPSSPSTNIALIVRYYATGVATAGSVRGVATFTLSYQ